MTRAVDVVIPVRDGGRLLARAVDSVLAQEGVDVRVFVVDDASTDGAVERLAPDERVVVLRNPGRGIPAALNAGVAAGDAEFVARQDADDESLPGRLRAEVDHLAAHPSIGLVGTAFDVLAGDRVITTMRPSPPGMLAKNPYCAGSTVARRDVLATAGGYREQFALSSDYDAWLRCAWHAGVSILDIVGYRYRLGRSMVTISKMRLQAAMAELARASARARMAGLPDPAEDPAAVRAALDCAQDDPAADAEIAAWWAREFAALGARGEALRCALDARRALPARRALGVFGSVLRPGPAQGGWA